jgi:membrane protein
MASTYGAAGALIIVLVWVFYSAQIFLLGAEFAKAYSDQRRTLHQLRQTSGEQTTEYMSLPE